MELVDGSTDGVEVTDTGDIEGLGDGYEVELGLGFKYSILKY